jgi:hypothetical protein
MDFKIRLVLDKATGHPPVIVFSKHRENFFFCPPNMMPLLQPMDQGVIDTLKASSSLALQPRPGLGLTLRVFMMV